MMLLDPHKFYLQFQSWLDLNKTYLYFQVERKALPSPDLLHRGYFQNQAFSMPPSHAESLFLDWWLHEGLPPENEYQVIWYLTWSPCCKCAVQVVEFLKAHGNVHLNIFVARLYYTKKPETHRGLHSLWQAGAQIKIMSAQDFENFWENFVDHQGTQFQPWENLNANYKALDRMLEDIHRSTMDLLTKEMFDSQFNNRRRVGKPYYTRNAYLCYQLKGPQPVKRCFQYKKSYHVVIRFIDEITSMTLDPANNYDITCYLTWSPCPYCAQRLVKFINDCHYVSLRIFMSRLYNHWCKDHIQGLQHLHKSNIQVAVMTKEDFTDCWENFVDHQGEPFVEWKNLESYSRSIARRYRKIVERSPTPHQDVLNEDFRNLHL